MFDRFVTFFARIAPDNIAFATLDGEVTYASFDADIDRFAARLRDEAGAGPGVLAAVSVANPYVHWLALMALARLGAPSMAAAPEYAPDILITDQSGAGALKQVYMSGDWLKSVLTGPRSFLVPVRPAPDSLGRLMFSSGTTGTRKVIALSWGAVIDQAKSRLMTATGRELRTMTMVGTDTILGFMTDLVSWCGGGTVTYAKGLAALPDSLLKLRPVSLSLATGQLAALLNMLPADFAPIKTLRINVGGSPVSKTLAQRTLDKLAGTVNLIYGSTEAGGVSVGPHTILDQARDAVGYINPGLDAEIVDEQGQPVTNGETGELRVRGPYVATAYLDNPEASAAVFRDGWFYPGDIGQLLPDGLLCIAGRKDELMNFGGLKMLPQPLEEKILVCPGVRDAALFAIDDAGGGQRAYLAVVRGPDFDEPALRQAVQTTLPGALFPLIVWTDAIPRNAMAKIDRLALVEAVIRTSSDLAPPSGEASLR